MNRLFGTDALFDPEDFAKLVCRLGLDIGITTLVVVCIYFRLYRKRDLVFTYYVLNVITFSVCALLRKTPMDMGFALGLFGIFGILRYRTEAIELRDLTYLFMVLGIAILNAVANKKISLSELALVNFVIVGLAFVVERRGRVPCSVTPVLYDRLELLHPDREEALLADLSKRTGLPVVHVDIVRIDMLRDAADLAVHYARTK